MRMDLSVANFGMFKLVLFVLMYNHIIACFWYELGHEPPEGEKYTWVTAYNDHGNNQPMTADLRCDTCFWMRYTTSLLWSMTQFGFGSTDMVQPVNTHENLFSIACVLFSLFVVSGILGSITNTMVRIQSSKTAETQQLELLRKFMRQRDVPYELSNRITRFAKNSFRLAQFVPINNVSLISCLSAPLQAELQYHMYKELFHMTKLLRHLSKNQRNTVHCVAAEALFVEVLAARDSLFVSKTLARGMFSIETGLLQYRKRRSSKDAPRDEGRFLEQGQWLCEAALFTLWAHVGTSRAITDSRTLRIDPDLFAVVVARDPHAYIKTAEYAMSYVKHLNTLERTDLSDVDRSAKLSIAKHRTDSRLWIIRRIFYRKTMK